jgi:RNA polymerase sigma factor (sigma-70 family)
MDDHCSPTQPIVHRGRSSTNTTGTIRGVQGLAQWRRRRRCQAEVLGAVAALGDVAEAVGFEEFFQVEYRGLVRALYLLTGDQGEAEELAQATMARVYERWDRVRVMESPAGYVYRAAVNLHRQRLRHMAVRARRLLAMAVHDESTQTPGPGVRLELAEAIASLPIGQRQAFMLVEWLGMSSQEAARILRIAPASVRTRTHRARATLRKRLGDDGGNRE